LLEQTLGLRCRRERRRWFEENLGLVHSRRRRVEREAPSGTVVPVLEIKGLLQLLELASGRACGWCEESLHLTSLRSVRSGLGGACLEHPGEGAGKELSKGSAPDGAAAEG